MVGYVVEATRPDGRRFLLPRPSHDRVKIHTNKEDAVKLATALNAIMRDRDDHPTSYLVLPYLI